MKFELGLNLTQLRAPILLSLVSATLLGCVPGAPAEVATRQRVQPAPRAASLYQRRWGNACGEHAAVGTMRTAPGHRFMLAFTAKQQDPPPPRVVSAHLDASTVRRLTNALQPHHAALMQCLGPGTGAGLVDVAIGTARAPVVESNFPAAASECVVALIRKALAGIDTGDTEFVAVRLLLDPDELPESPGSLSKEQIREVIAAHIGEVRSCYELALDVWPTLQGTQRIRFVVEADGQVAFAATASTTLHNPAVECCITTALKNWRFAPPNGGGIVVVTYPFVLGQKSLTEGLKVEGGDSSEM